MITGEVKFRVRYSETDRMGYVYYGHYAQYFEVARVEMLRSLGFSYKKLEDEGVILPVLEYFIKYIRPAYYDDELIVKTTINEMPSTRILFNYETYNEKDELLNTAKTTLVFVNQKSGRPTALPADLKEAMEKYF